MPVMAEARERPVYTARGPVEGEDWGAVAAVLNERMAARRIGQQELATLSGVSVSTLRQVQHGAGRRVQNKTLTAISRALGWPDDHLSTILLSSTPPARRTTDTSTADRGQTTEALTHLQTQLGEISQRLAAIEQVLLRNG
jgi:DNA-binding Xre family transcriptional regulator